VLNDVNLSGADLNLLVLFEVVLEERNVRRAASRLRLSASAVSHGLRRLRQLLNDPVFLRTPRGVVPTERALALAAPIAEILGGVRRVLGDSRPFDPATSSRRFVLSAPDGVWTWFLPRVLPTIRAAAPGIDLGILHLRIEDVIADLDARTIDVAIAPTDDIPARFAARTLYQDDFVIAARAGHPWLAAPTLDGYCQQGHVVVSADGERRGFIDVILEGHGRSRRIAAVVPSALLALAIVETTDLVAALPRRMMAHHGARFGAASAEPPLPVRRFDLRAIAPVAAMADGGVAWLIDTMQAAVRADPAARGPAPRRPARGGGGPSRRSGGGRPRSAPRRRAAC
jgi:DNA-binding transcriptional LysR family regulator